MAPPRILITGGGPAALEATLRLRALLGDRPVIELVAPQTEFRFRPLSVLECFGLDGAAPLDLRELAHDAGALFRNDALRTVDQPRSLIHTSRGLELSYDMLLVAAGARTERWLPGAIDFDDRVGPDGVRVLLGDLEQGGVRRVAFAGGVGPSWVLPLYELAALTSAFAAARSLAGVELFVVTPEDAPLGVFGSAASAALGALLDDREIHLLTGRHARGFANGTLRLVEGVLDVDRVVALPRLVGPRIVGLPSDPLGFVPVDLHAQVVGLGNVFAAGDVTSSPVKHGGLAAQQADVAAASIARLARADVPAETFDPILRGLLLTGGIPQFLSARISGGHGETSVARDSALWWPPTKIAAPELARFLASRGHADIATAPEGGVEVEARIEADPIPRESVAGA